MLRVHRVILCLLLLFTNAPALNAQDTASLPVGEGDQLRLQIFGQENISGVYQIGPNGTLEIPGLGVLHDLKTFSDMRAGVQKLIDANLGLPDTAFSVTMQEWRPVYVGGYVAEPGRKPYSPGLRAAHAIALAGGWRVRQSDLLTQTIQINQEKERLAQAQTRLAKALITEARLDAELNGGVFDQIPDAAIALVGQDIARQLAETDRKISETKQQSFALAKKRIGAALDINSEDISAQQSFTSSLKTQLELVRGDLERLKPLIDKGAITGARILALRKDFVQIEGQVGQATASLANARTSRVVLQEEKNVLDLQIKLDTLSERASVQLSILEARAAIETISNTLETAGASPIILGTGKRKGDCKLLILRNLPGEATPTLLEANAMTPLMPGDLLQVGRKHRSCPDLLTMSGLNE